MGIQHVYKTHKEDLDRSGGWVAIIVYFEDDIEFNKIQKFPKGCQWAKIMQPGYSLKPMAVSEGQHILLVHIDNIPDFFIEIAGHPCLILPQTLEQKKETRHRCYQKWYHEDGGQDISGITPGEVKTNKRKQYYCGGGQEKAKSSAPAQDFANFSTSGVLPERLQCDCGKTFKVKMIIVFKIIFIDACPYMKKG